jgi:hypothetical protein
MERAKISDVPPAAKGTTMRMALAGKVVCAWTDVNAAVDSRATPINVEEANFLNMKKSPFKFFVSNTHERIEHVPDWINHSTVN